MDFKYSNILRELEIKDTTISSLESMLYRKDEEIQRLKESHRLFTGNVGNKEYNNYGAENTFNTNYNSESIQKDFVDNGENSLRSTNNFPKENFNKDVDNENELKNLITGNHIGKPSTSRNFSKDNTNFESNAGNFDSRPFNNSNTSMKIPGRIVSFKKKL